MLFVHKTSNFDILKIYELVNSKPSLVLREVLSNQWMQNEMTGTVSGTIGEMLDCGGECTGNLSIYSLPELGAFDSTLADFCCTRIRVLCCQIFSFIKEDGKHIFKRNHPYFIKCGKFLLPFKMLFRLLIYYSGWLLISA